MSLKKFDEEEDYLKVERDLPRRATKDEKYWL